jgi:hypothetical protein
MKGSEFGWAHIWFFNLNVYILTFELSHHFLTYISMVEQKRIMTIIFQKLKSTENKIELQKV